VAVEWNQPVTLKAIRIADGGGALLADLPVAGTRRRFEVPWQFEAGRQYQIEFLADVPLAPILWRAPQERWPLRASIELPTGQPAARWTSDPKPTDVAMTPGDHPLTLRIESLTQAALEVIVELAWSHEVEVELEDSGWTAEVGRASRREKLHFQFDDRTLDGRIALKESAARGEIRCRVRGVDGAGKEFQLGSQLELQATTSEQIAGLIEAGALQFPVDSAGESQVERPADEVVLGSAWWRRWRQWLTGSTYAINDFEPVGYQGLELRSTATYPLNLLLESDVVPIGSGEPAIEFAPPRWLAPREVSWGEHLVRIGPREVVQVQLPLFVRAETKGGNYTRRVRVYLLGDSKPIAEFAAPLRVCRGDPVLSTVTVMCLLAVPVVVGGATGWGKTWTRRIGVEGLAIIGLLGGLQLAVSLLARLGGDILAAVLGPFAVVISGIGNEGMTSLLFAVVVVFVPRVGAFSLTAATVFVLNAMLSGQIGLVDFVFVAISMLLGELALTAVGITGWKQGADLPMRSGWATALRLGLALGVANGATMFCQYCVVQVLYRLFFAWWYVLFVSLVVGGLYGAIGATLGARMGQRLRRTLR